MTPRGDSGGWGDAGAAADRRRATAVAVWLLVIGAMVFFMVVLGGLTRLTHSGLSMVDWRPVTGWLPPLTAAEWEAVFDLYRQTPEYREVNIGMTVAEFKGIFWLEYVHRLWGRLMGVAFLIPALVFALRGWVDRRLALHLAAMFVLGGLQGVLGWYMVKSGLVDRPDVSQYRLTAHLGAALVIIGYILWVALGMLSPRPRPGEGRARHGLWWGAVALVGLVFVTILSGGFVAGLDAGLTYNTFPLMDGELVPSGIYDTQPFWIAAFEDVTTVQFDHRVLAMAVAVAVALFWVRARTVPAVRARRAAHLLAVIAAVQVALGITTLLLVVPVPLAAAHQAVAVLLFAATLWTAHELRPA